MKEHQPVPHEISEGEVLRDMLSIDEMAQSLASEPRPRTNRVYGEGFYFPLGEPENPEVDLMYFPQGKNVQYVSPDASIALFRIETPILAEDGVVFESKSEDLNHTLVVKNTGEATYISAHPRQELEADPWDVPIAPIDSPAPVVQDTSSEDKTSSNTKETAEKQERVNVVGRAGRDPRVTETRNGTLIAKFPLAEHLVDEEGSDQTKWWNVVAFKTRAAEVAKTVKKGETYRVVGYLHEKEGRGGKIEHEIYAVAVKPPSNKGKNEGGEDK